uniref:Uncharacterized protein n=1 Tax=Mustela putorius furo TaxID=9669 RepID=M3XTJ9_MUSPF
EFVKRQETRPGVAHADPEPRPCCCVSRDHLELLGKGSPANSCGAHQRTGTRGCCVGPHPDGATHLPRPPSLGHGSPPLPAHSPGHMSQMPQKDAV